LTYRSIHCIESSIQFQTKDSTRLRGADDERVRAKSINSFGSVKGGIFMATVAGRAHFQSATVKTEGLGGTPVTRPYWQDVADRFPDDRDCLASFLVLEVAEVLERVKPANLVNIANKRRPCGRNLYQLWKAYGADLLSGSGLQVRELADRKNSVLLLFYRPEVLTELMSRKSVAGILGRSGYSDLGNLDGVLGELAKRVSGNGFPHEIGVFLGYPIKDVVGFMGWTQLSFSCQGPWKIFGDPSESLRLAETHRQCRCRISQLLASGMNPQERLKVGASSQVAARPTAKGVFLSSN
jgi:hypothetical protein